MGKIQRTRKESKAIWLQLKISKESFRRVPGVNSRREFQERIPKEVSRRVPEEVSRREFLQQLSEILGEQRETREIAPAQFAKFQS